MNNIDRLAEIVRDIQEHEAAATKLKREARELRNLVNAGYYLVLDGTATLRIDGDMRDMPFLARFKNTPSDPGGK